MKLHCAVRRRVVVAACLLTATIALLVPARAQTSRINGDELMATVKTLASPDFAGRRTGTPGGIKARGWVLEQVKAIGLRPIDGAHLMSFGFEPAPARGSTEPAAPTPIETANIMGLCPGKDPKRGAIIVSAHFDHLGVRNGDTYFGADDNASGVAVLLALAKQCLRQPLQHDVLFVAFDAEEMGLRGARAFAEKPPIPRDRIVLNVNLDMVSRGDKGELYAAGTYHYPKMKPALEGVAKKSPIKLLFGHDVPKEAGGKPQDDWTTQSDHGAFHRAGIPFIYFGVEDHPDYHKPSDTADKINPIFFRQAAETILDALIALDALTSYGK